jgi:zinc protease
MRSLELRLGVLLLAVGCATAQPVATKAPPPAPPAQGGPDVAASAPPTSPVVKGALLPVPPAVGPVVLPPSAQPLVAVQLRFRTGAIDDPQGEAGITALAARILSEGGTQALTSQQLLEALFPYAASWSVLVDKEETTFSIRVHRDGLQTVVGLLTDALTHPRWDAREFDRLRDAQINDIEKRLRQADDENLGKEALGEFLYQGHPYGRLTSGHVSDLRKLTLQEVRAHAGRVFTRDRLSIGLAGGCPAGLEAQLEAALLSLPATGAAPPPLAVAVPGHPRFLLVEKKAASMAISIGVPWALGRGDPDWAAMSVARSAFGEHRQFNGRLMKRLRGERGLNYGDYAYLEFFVQQGGGASLAETGRVRRQQAFSIWLRPVQNDNALFALRAALYELQRSVGEEPFSEEEVERTKGFLDGYLLLFAQTDERKLGYALDDQFLGLRGFLPTWHSALPAVSTAQVNAAWRRWVHPEELQVVIVTPDAEAMKKALLSGAASPVHYPVDAEGHAAEKPKAVTEADATIATFPFGARGEADVRIIRVSELFE